MGEIEKTPSVYEDSQESNKITEWANKAKEIDSVTDRLGMPIEEGIKEGVIALNLLGIATSQSCEGHSDRGMGAPWIDISAPNEPGWQFEGQGEVFDQVAAENNVTADEIIDGFHNELLREAYSRLHDKPYTPEYQQWLEENGKLRAATEKLVEEFYQEHQPEMGTEIIFDTGKAIDKNVTFTIHNGREDYMLVERMSPEQLQGLSERLKKNQAEFAQFIEFLKRKFFEEK